MKKVIFCVLILYMQGWLALYAQAAHNIAQARLALYQRSSEVDNRLLNMLYTQMQSIQDPEEKMWLTVRLGILFCEAYLYHASAFPFVRLEDLQPIYKEFRKKVLKSKSVRVLQESGEFSFYMMRLFPRKKLAYLMDARMFFLKALSADKNNVKTKLGLGKWWVYRIMNVKNHEINHAVAQVDKYLNEENITAVLAMENDAWHRINMAHIYYLRAIVNRRALRTDRAQKDEKMAQSLLPSPVLHALMQSSHDNTPVGWF